MKFGSLMAASKQAPYAREGIFIEKFVVLKDSVRFA